MAGNTSMGQSLGQALGQFAFGGDNRKSQMKGMLDGAHAGAYDANRQHSLAQALKAQAEASQLQAENDSRTPARILSNAMTGYGIPQDDVQAVNGFLNTGTLGGKYSPSIDGYGPTAPAPAWAGKLPDLARSVQGVNTALTIGDKNSENIAKAGAIQRGARLSDEIMAGLRNRNTVGGAEAAVSGKPLYHADASGAVLDQYGGQLDTNNPMAGASINLKKEQARAQTANAAQSYASAGSSNASAAKTRQETAQGGKGVLRDTDQGLMLVNPMTGKSTPVTGGDGASLTKTKASGPMSVTLQKELLESDDTVQLSANVVKTLEKAKTLNSASYSGYGAKGRAMLRSNLPGTSVAADNTIDIDNMMTGQGLESMKSIFGAAPTEGERKILMDMQASADKTPEQREKIMDRAIGAAQRRAQYASGKAKSIRDGSYLTRGAEAMPRDTQQASPVRSAADKILGL